MNRIIHGSLPSVVFKAMLLDEPSLGNAGIARAFLNHFDDVSTEAAQVIWHWRRPGRENGLSDHEVDKLLLRCLERAGYEFVVMPNVPSPVSTDESEPKEGE